MIDMLFSRIMAMVVNMIPMVVRLHHLDVHIRIIGLENKTKRKDAKLKTLYIFIWFLLLI